MGDSINTFIYVVGPNKQGTWDPESKKSFVQACNQYPDLKCIEIGDGKRNIKLEEIKDALSKNLGPFFFILECHGERELTKEAKAERLKIKNELNQILEDSKTKGWDNQSLNLFVTKNAELEKFRLDNADEQYLEKELFIVLNDERISITQIFKLANEVQPHTNTHYFTSCCYGGQGHGMAYNYLKPGDYFMALGEANRITFWDDTDHFIKTFNPASTFYNGKIYPKDIYTDFVATDYYSKLAPSFFQSLPKLTVNKQTFDPNSLTFPRVFTEEQNGLVHQRLDSLKGADFLNRVINEMGSATKLTDLSPEYQGTAIAIQHIASIPG